MGKKKDSRASKKQVDLGKTLPDTARQVKGLEWVFMGVLLAAGIYLSIVYFGQKGVPNSDFPAFVQTGREIVHFQMPSSFKRLPVLGILQIAAGRLMVASPHPVLTGALVLNGILYALSILLLYRITRFFIAPMGSFCLGLVAAVNPFALAMAVDPIAETTIVFFILLTLYLILRRSRWCYLAAMLASMTRYECFGLIGIALLFDLFTLKTKRQKLTALGIAFAAAVPMIFWMVGTKITTTDPTSTYYKHFLNVEHRNGFNLLKMLWTTSFSPLLQWPEWIRAILVERPTTQQAADAIQSHNNVFRFMWNSIAAVLFLAGVIGSFLKKQRRFLGILLFWAGYVCIHMSQSVLIDRYTLPVVWLTLLTAAFGIGTVAALLNTRLPRGVLAAIGAVGAIIAVLWMFQLWPAVGQTARVSAASRSVVYVGLLLAAVGLAAKQVLCRGRDVRQDICLFTAAALMIVSNQFSLAFRLGQGDTDIEFKKLAQWYLENAQQGEKLATTMPGVVNLFLPEGRQNAIHTGGIAGSNLAEFAQTCRQHQVVYVAWDSRLGFAVNDEYYKSWGLSKIHPLGGGKDIAPFRFIKKIEASPQRYLYVYRLDTEKIPESRPPL
ncbi:MAG: glycosyltransferase family 39 protein [Planctomycetales bacterium]|nr:glycosyltransferase family 39 protein [Planctomycetales bacterium]